MENNVKNRIKELTSILNSASSLYYNGFESKMTDSKWDRLLAELTRLENETGFSLPDSPTKKVGYEVVSRLKKVTHSHSMLSLDKTKSIDRLNEFIKNNDGYLMCKMDGLTILLTYDKGILTQAETRGDGQVGEIITHNARVFENIPQTIDYKEHLEVEGEAIITYQDFNIINNELIQKATEEANDKGLIGQDFDNYIKEHSYKNPRNLASGSVRLLDSSIAAKRHLKFIAWKVPSSLDNAQETMYHKLKEIEKYGFDTVPAYWITANQDVSNCVDKLKEEAKDLGYPIDGLVLSYNDIPYGLSLGSTSKFPRHSIAFKFYEDDEETIITDVEFTMGKTGVLTPTAVFNTVKLAGTEVSRASLHNITILKDLQIGIGDTVYVYKANEIIPQIRNNLTRSGNITIPDKCPVCGHDTKIIKENDSEVLICTNPDCEGKLLGKLSHFVSRNTINIDGMSEATLQFLIDKGWVNKFSDIFNLSSHKHEWMNCEGFGRKSVDKLLDNIELAKNTTLSKFLYSLSIPLIGKTASKTIDKYFTDLCINSDGDMYDNPFSIFMYRVKTEPYKYWTQLSDFGDKMALSIFNYFKVHYDEIEELAQYFTFEFDAPQTAQNENSAENIIGKTFVITGSLNHFANRNELIAKIESLGGKVSGSISSKTNYLINNDVNSTSSKNKKAKSLDIPIISEDDFISMFS